MELSFMHHPDDTTRSTWEDWVMLVTMIFIWHTLRAWFSTWNGKEGFVPLFLTNVSKEKEQTAYRNTQHGLLGTFHCVGVMLVTSCMVVQHWDETWDDWFGHHTTEIDSRYTVQAVWAIAFSLSYFVSDLIYIFDFPVYLNHHIVSTLLLFSCMVIVEMRFCGVAILWCAEIGGIMLALYVKYRTLNMLILFCLAYGISRLMFSVVSYQLCVSNYKSARMSDDICAILVVVLVIINWDFWLKHVKKLRAKLTAKQD